MKYYNEIKNQLINNEINRKVKNYAINKSDIETYYNVGKLLSAAGKHYGEGIIKEYSRRLTKELGKGYTETNLKYFRSFYYFSKSHTLCDELMWSHYRTLLSLHDFNQIEYYIYLCKSNHLSVRQLRERIKSKEYERLPEVAKQKIIKHDLLDIKETIPNPIIINNKSNYEGISEKVLQRIIMEDISSFLEALGTGYSFIKNEFKIKIGDTYNYIDLLLYNLKYRCYVVIELKIRPLDKKDLGQIEVYMNYINDNIKCSDDNKTLGIIICEEDNNLIIKYSSDERIISRKYLIK